MIGPPLRNSSQMPIIAQRVPLQTDPFSSRTGKLPEARPFGWRTVAEN